LDRPESSRVASKAVERAHDLFKQKTEITIEMFKQEEKKLQADRDQLDETERKLLEFASERIT
jgi:Holliday junction resolvasome RuvABC ATP-dependent DNA helicase subunit